MKNEVRIIIEGPMTEEDVKDLARHTYHLFHSREENFNFVITKGFDELSAEEVLEKIQQIFKECEDEY